MKAIVVLIHREMHDPTPARDALLEQVVLPLAGSHAVALALHAR
jgi:hypothetical protein